jgi:hypothetical protein
MTFTISFSWWTIPAIITALSAIFLIWVDRGSRDPWDSLGLMVMCIPVLLVNTLAWMIGGFLK